MSSIDLTMGRGATGTRLPVSAVTPHPVIRATAMSSVIGLVAGLVLGFVTQAREHDAG